MADEAGVSALRAELYACRRSLSQVHCLARLLLCYKLIIQSILMSVILTCEHVVTQQQGNKVPQIP